MAILVSGCFATKSFILLHNEVNLLQSYKVVSLHHEVDLLQNIFCFPAY